MKNQIEYLITLEAYVEALRDDSLAEAEILAEELHQLALDAQAISPITNLLVS